MPKSKLSRKHRAFIAEYFRLNMNGTRAYASVYGLTDDKAAQACASRLLSNAIVSAEIDEQMRKLAMTPEEILARLSSHARGNIDDFIGTMDRVDLDQARTRGSMHLAKKIKQHTTTISKPNGEDVEYHDIEIELYDAQAASVQLAKIFGQFVERIEVSDLRDKADDDLIREFQTILDAARTRAGASDSE